MSAKGSRKLKDSYCLARMYVKHNQSTGRVEVEYYYTHTNHLLGLEECKFLPLPLSVRKDIQEKFAQEVTLERIMDGSYVIMYMVDVDYKNIHSTFNTDVREGLGGRQHRHAFGQVATRRHFVTRQDCRNICRKTRDFTNHRHDNDALSVDRIVKELQLEDPSPVIAYKPQGITNEQYPLLREDKFLLVLMTGFQARLFERFATLGCVDATHKTNEYGYKLITLMVADEFRNGEFH